MERDPAAWLSSTRIPDILGLVTKRLIQVDDAKLDAVRELLGTRTLKATVDEVLNEVLALDRRRRSLLARHGVASEELAEPDQRAAAWR